MQMVAPSITNARSSESYHFYPFLTLIFGMSTFCSNKSGKSLWHSVSIYPENFNTNIPCLLKLKPKAFLWVYKRYSFSKLPQCGWGADFEGASPYLFYVSADSKQKQMPTILIKMKTENIQIKLNKEYWHKLQYYINDSKITVSKICREKINGRPDGGQPIYCQGRYIGRYLVFFKCLHHKFVQNIRISIGCQKTISANH